MPTADSYRYHGTVIRVAIPSPLRRLFDYLPPKNATPNKLTKSANQSLAAATEAALIPGSRVRVPFGRREVIGVIMEIAGGSELDRSKLKPVKKILDTESVFSSELFKVLRAAIRYYHHPPGEVIATALPTRLRQGEAIRPTEQYWQTSDISAEQRDKLLQRAPKQRALFNEIVSHGKLNRLQFEALGFSSAILRELLGKKLIEEFCLESPAQANFEPIAAENTEQLTLNADQSAAVQRITQSLSKFCCFVLDGVTGSGKTEVYTRTMSAVLERGQQCLILVPEIGLTPQTIRRFAERFSCPIAALHSGLNDTERLEAWRQAYEGSAGIVIGTRSSIFCSLANPGLIVVDEEHDSSFKQQDGFRYSARDLAVMRGQEEGVPVILGSATPSLETLLNIERGRYQHLRLRERAGNAVPAQLELIDVAQQAVESGFHEAALLRINKHLHNGNQVLVFINRRGFAPMLHCLSCGWVAECEECIAQYTVHARPAGLRCHHCGAVEALPQACPSCASRQLSTLGQGTQQLEIMLSKQYPHFPVLRIDRDSTRSRKRFDAMLKQVASGEPCILLGTQMLAKGHHFPGITLVVVVDADSGLFSADFRGQEHMAQTIVQVAGRAGRAEQAGEVLVQSRHASHETLQALSNLEYAEFAQQLLADRQLSAMPPYSHFALLRCEARSLNTGMQFLSQVQQQAGSLIAQQSKSVDCLGPLPSPMEKRAGRYRCQLLLQAAERADLQNLLSPLMQQLEALKTPTGLRWSLDVDPQDMI